MSLKANFSGKNFEAGVDEAGRGCLAGAVVAAAVIFPLDYEHPSLNDSKQLSAKKRLMFRKVIEEDAFAYAIGVVSPAKIDEINILNASFLAMHRALEKLSVVPEHILVDGNRFKQYKKIPHDCIVKGDAKYLSIAAASILAKTERDFYMQKLAKEFPHYGWQTNMGYPTVKHREAIVKYGITPHHRKSFKLLPEKTLFSN